MLTNAGMKCTPLFMSHAEIINRWPSLSAFAEDLSVSYGTAKAMRRRGGIPDRYWLTAVEAADRRGLDGVTLEGLARAISITPPPTPKPQPQGAA